ncbi:MAG: hypothetical protein U0S36_08595 [Candidatus Nanopelagicales bacterium]
MASWRGRGHHARERPPPGPATAVGPQWADDEISELPEQIVDPEDLRPSPLDDDVT